ncbi:hypothetical protein [Archangium sp.]|uniref:hypothetical protein n=1 Tax=Archangium sp. TaxID=1872627 RepID=UPI002D6D193E|nr:hypothetical protein [Archangium sp.]HYO58054.1 hypothetical protein [Archangium sp.]
MTEKKPAEELAGVLERARAIRPRLAKATDKLNQVIEEAEKALAALQLGVRGEVNLDFDEESGWYRSLVFGKEDKVWRLLIETGDCVVGEIHSTTPLVNASREIRLQVIGKLPELVQKMMEAAEEEVRRVEATVAQAESFTLSLMRGAK